MPEPDARAADAADTALLADSVRESGAIARRYFGGSYKTWAKGRGDPVTEADIAIDRHLHAVLTGRRPAYGWLSEETEDDRTRLTKDRIFVVDPIDGTIGFIKGRPHFTIVAAVVDAGRPVAAAIYNPISDELFEATLGGGARLNGRPIRARDRDVIDGAHILGASGLAADPRWRAPLPASVTVENRASLAYRLALVAAGMFDAMVSLSIKRDWDLAAGDLILNEAGARLTSDTGTVLLYNQTQTVQRGVVGAAPRLHGLLLNRLNPSSPRIERTS